jgi:polyphenol oxidase
LRRLSPYLQLLAQPKWDAFPLVRAGTLAGLLGERWFDFSAHQSLGTLSAHVTQCMLGLGGRAVVMMDQGCGDNQVVRVHHAPRLMPQADALITRVSQLVLLVRSADCLPIIVYDALHHQAAVIHAGWSGLMAHIIGRTIKQMRTPAAQLSVWIGPGISAHYYQVGSDFRQRWLAIYPHDADCFRQHVGRYYFDLYAVAQRQLHQAGVQRVTVTSVCTYQHEQAYSHRAWCHGLKPYGRLASFVVLA